MAFYDLTKEARAQKAEQIGRELLAELKANKHKKITAYFSEAIRYIEPHYQT